MDRKAIARETLDIMERGYYEINGKMVDISNMHAASVKGSKILQVVRSTGAERRHKWK